MDSFSEYFDLLYYHKKVHQKEKKYCANNQKVHLSELINFYPPPWNFQKTGGIIKPDNFRGNRRWLTRLNMHVFRGYRKGTLAWNGLILEVNFDDS